MGSGPRNSASKGRSRAEDLTQLCEGYDPRDPSRHVRNAGVNEGDRARKHGDDLCFSAPKSVSVAWALGSEELRAAIEKAMHRAVKDALDYIQDECGWSRVGAQGQEHRTRPAHLRPLRAFQQPTRRPAAPHSRRLPEPHPSHEREGQARGHGHRLDELLSPQMTAGALFRASLAQGMRDIGFEMGATRLAATLRVIVSP